MIHNKLSEVFKDINAYGKNKFIIVTGGIGDFITIDNLFMFSLRKYIIFISSQSLKLKKLMNFYNKNGKFYSIYFNFSLIKKPGFNNSNELLKYFPFFKNIHIVNILEYFPIIKNNLLNKSIIINNYIYKNIFNLQIKQKYNIPNSFAVINPFTEDNKICCVKCHQGHPKNMCQFNLTRNFINIDYLNTFNFLKEHNICGVIISVKKIIIPNDYEDINIINLSNLLSIEESIELTKQCSYFFGIDSLFSVIASKLLPSDKIYIKSNNDHAHNNKNVYWYPIKNINLHNFITT